MVSVEKKRARKPKRLQRRRSKGWRKPANGVIVDRTTRWGNPFKTAEQFSTAIDMVSTGLLFAQRELTKDQFDRVRHILDHVHELRGKDLICWCGPDKSCHADVLLELANK